MPCNVSRADLSRKKDCGNLAWAPTGLGAYWHQIGTDPARSTQLCFQPPPVVAAKMIPKGKAKSSKPSIRWPWSKKSKGHPPVEQQPDPEDQVPAVKVDLAEINAGPTSSGVEDPTSRRPSSSASGSRPAQAETPSSFFPNASHWVVNGGLQINANQHGYNSNDSGELLVRIFSLLG